MKPSDLGLPEKFAEWRPHQLEVAAKINASRKYAFLLDSPTGTGKSIIAAAVQRISGKKMRYLTTTKQLQDQLLKDFPYAATLKGRSNYICLRYPRMFPVVSAEHCTHKAPKECPHVDRCYYLKAKEAALAAPLAVLNASYFLHEANYVGTFSNSELLMIDEFDTMEDQLMSFVEVNVTRKQLDKIGLPPPKYKTKFESWVEWALPAVRGLEKEIKDIKFEQEQAWGLDDFSLIKKLRTLERLHSKLSFFVKEVDSSWVWYPGDDRWVFKPVWIAKYSNGTLWKHAKKVIGMSATILDPVQVAYNTGLFQRTEGLFDRIALPSPFPKENRPIYYEPCANVVSKLMNVALPKLNAAVTRIMEKHPNDKILLHTVSYRVRNYLLDHLPKGRLITHATTDRDTVLTRFKSSNKPLVLLSPSMDRGVDLPKEECRVVIIAKCPYADISDPQTSRRVYGSKDGNKWYSHKTISTIVQMAGRGVRSSDDHASTYILDEQFGRLVTEHRSMFPAWFLEAIVS